MLTIKNSSRTKDSMQRMNAAKQEASSVNQRKNATCNAIILGRANNDHYQ